MDDVWTDATTDGTDNVWTLGNLAGIHAGNLPLFSPHEYQGILMGFQLMVTEWMTYCQRV